ncbi:MAG: hypothetical protein C4292_00340 [Nitrososphaera sp.]
MYQLYSVRVTATVHGKGKSRDALSSRLKELGIMSKVYFSPIHLTTFYKRQFGYRGGELPVTERISSEILSLPMYPHISTQDMDRICTGVAEFFGA